jgi:hypothetical protein
MKHAIPFSSLNYEFQFRGNEFSRHCRFDHSSKPDFCHQPFFSRYERIAAMFSSNLAPELADLAEIAVAAYLADRFSPRRHPEDGSTASPRHRRIELCVQVNNPEIWTGTAARILQDLFWFLTCDEWKFQFQASAGVSIVEQAYLFDFSPPQKPKVMLFSGGLDSYAGAMDQLSEAERYHVLLSGSTHNRMAAGQRRQASRLLEGRRERGQHVVIPYGLPQKLDVRMESSQRSRSFVHLSLGAIAALHLGDRELFVYENGIGALNLPFDSSQLGWEVSRAVHPKTLTLMERLLAAIGWNSFQIRTPFFFSTKAESLVHASTMPFVDGIRETFSCDRFPNYREGTRQCGVCSSCILRRLSLEAAGLSHIESATDYAHDVASPEYAPRPGAAFILEKFDAQAHRLRRSLSAAKPWEALTRLYPELHELGSIHDRWGLSPAEIATKLIRLYHTHVLEWERFSGRNALERYLTAA